MNFKIIKNARVYAPQYRGLCDIFIAGEKIGLIQEHIDIAELPIEVIDAEGKIATPGFIDRHVHIIGGGGQQGYASLVPEVTVSELVSCGITTVVGLLGTDGYVKDLNSLYAKTKALCQEGLSAYMLTSFYGLPERTLTNSVAEDLIYIDKVIGCKLAMSDDRSSFPTELEILRLINQVRLGGFTSGKGGFLHIHLGNLPSGISPLLHIAKNYPTLIRYISPTHMIRTEELFQQSVEFAKMGGFVDYSTGGTRFKSPHACVLDARQLGVPLHHISFSSDGHGGVRRVNPETGEVTYRPAPLGLNLNEVSILNQECDMPLEQAITLITSNPATHMNLSGKGRIEDGYDADICFLDDKLKLTDVISKGELMMRNCKIIKKGRYE